MYLLLQQSEHVQTFNAEDISYFILLYIIVFYIETSLFKDEAQTALFKKPVHTAQ